MSFLERRAETEIEFGAPPHEVWAVLTDFAAFGEWNPLILQIDGELAEQERLDVKVSQNGKVASLRPLVLRVSPARQIRLLGRLGPGGLLDTEHYFVLKPREDGTTGFTHGARFTGLLVPFFKNLAAETERDFTAMNEALGERLAKRE